MLFGCNFLVRLLGSRRETDSEESSAVLKALSGLQTGIEFCLRYLAYLALLFMHPLIQGIDVISSPPLRVSFCSPFRPPLCTLGFESNTAASPSSGVRA